MRYPRDILFESRPLRAISEVGVGALLYLVVPGFFSHLSDLYF